MMHLNGGNLHTQFGGLPPPKQRRWAVEMIEGDIETVEAHWISFENGGVVAFWDQDKMKVAYSPGAWKDLWEETKHDPA